MKLNKKHMIITMVLLTIVISILYFFLKKEEAKLELLGSPEETIMINSFYEDKGVNLKDAESNGSVNTKKAGTYTLEYQYKSQLVKRIVNVLDNQQIVMNLNGSTNTYVKQGQEYIEAGCHVIDKDEGNLTTDVKIKGKVDTLKEGEYTILYEVTNKKGIMCSKQRTVHVISKEDFEENKNGVPVMMYHYVYTEKDKPNELNSNYIKDTNLEKQLKYLKQNNYYFVSYQELFAYVQGKIDLPEKSIILTFDDGQKGFLKYGIPLLEKYQIPATSFIIASKNGAKKIRDYASEYISFQSHSYDMHKAGGTIGHGGVISSLSKNEIVKDLKKSQEIVQNTEAFAYPYGDITKEGKEATQDANILCSFTTEYGKVKKGDDPRALSRIRVLGDNTLEGFISSIR